MASALCFDHRLCVSAGPSWRRLQQLHHNILLTPALLPLSCRPGAMLQMWNSHWVTTCSPAWTKTKVFLKNPWKFHEMFSKHQQSWWNKCETGCESVKPFGFVSSRPTFSPSPRCCFRSSSQKNSANFKIMKKMVGIVSFLFFKKNIKLSRDSSWNETTRNYPTPETLTRPVGTLAVAAWPPTVAESEVSPPGAAWTSETFGAWNILKITDWINKNPKGIYV